MSELGRIAVLEAILKERELQDAIWENQDEYTDSWWHIIVAEKNGEVAKEIFNNSNHQLIRKIIEACAVYFAWAEAVHRRQRE